MELEWNVFRYDCNADKFVTYNIFKHGGFLEDLKKLCKKYNKEYPYLSYEGNTKENKKIKTQFFEELKRNLKYYFWSKCEMELVLVSWPVGDIEEKIDIWDQLEMNWNRFSNYVWVNYCSGNIVKKRKKKGVEDNFNE